MKQCVWGLLLLTMSGAAFAAETILFADFSNKPLNQPIGTGGAGVGEPVDVSSLIEALVRAAPGGGRELELFKEPSFGTASTRFRFLNAQEVTEGQLRAGVALRLGTADQFSRVSVLMREAPGSAQSFLNLDLSSDGEVQIRRSGFPALRFSDAAVLSAINRIEILYDLDEKRLSMCVNGALLVSDLDAGIQTERGIGSVLLSLPAAGETLIWLDSIEVQKGPFENGDGDRLFADRFESGLPACPF